MRKRRKKEDYVGSETPYVHEGNGDTSAQRAETFLHQKGRKDGQDILLGMKIHQNTSFRNALGKRVLFQDVCFCNVRKDTKAIFMLHEEYGAIEEGSLYLKVVSVSVLCPQQCSPVIPVHTRASMCSWQHCRKLPKKKDLFLCSAADSVHCVRAWGSAHTLPHNQIF
eukprot:1152402-Pelagomonas_calceolata.AAC.10